MRAAQQPATQRLAAVVMCDGGWISSCLQDAIELTELMLINQY
jgi:hypothetical protein